ncbi:Hypothetical predicted protein [Mytilus galloprovincialis]|uniref:Uncharacterized protein n=1 Tax=Mytilus galloprovincialis TaxID=29158 RepID=A0A8B6GYI2_MYTGA|nr:Hypothetical predicted protein [Mytilus galloprovincialis]
MYNVTIEDEGRYQINLLFRVETTRLQLAKLWFINQTNLKTIAGQEGEIIHIICGSNAEQFITALTLESNGTIKAIGDNQTVSYSFIPDRTDHLTKYQCVDSKHLSIMIEVELRIRCPPVFAKENRLVKIGKVGQSSIRMSFYVYSYPDIEEIFLQNNVRPSHTNDNQGQNLTQQHAATILNEANVQSTDNDSNELSTDFPNDDLPQLGVPDVREQLVSISTDDTNIIDDRQQHEQSSDQKSQTSDDSDSESSRTLMAGNVGDGYENPYQTVLQDHQESHQYTKITIERNISVSSAESNCEMQILEKSLPKEAGYINLQF